MGSVVYNKEAKAAIWIRGLMWFFVPLMKLGVSKNRGVSPKMDGEHNGKPYFLMDDLAGKPTIFGNTQLSIGKNLQNHGNYINVFCVS